MQILEIEVPDGKANQVKDFLKKMGIIVKVKKEGITVELKGKIPNADTIAAIEELKAGNGKKFKSVEELFNSI